MNRVPSERRAVLEDTIREDAEYDLLLRKEATLDRAPLSKDVEERRLDIVTRVMNICAHCRYTRETYHFAVNVFDRVRVQLELQRALRSSGTALNLSRPEGAPDFDTLMCAALLFALKFVEGRDDHPAVVAEAWGGQVSPRMLCVLLERFTLNSESWQLVLSPTPLRWFQFFHSSFWDEHDGETSPGKKSAYSRTIPHGALRLMDACSLNWDVSCELPGNLAAAALLWGYVNDFSEVANAGPITRARDATLLQRVTRISCSMARQLEVQFLSAVDAPRSGEYDWPKVKRPIDLDTIQYVDQLLVSRARANLTGDDL
jgi:hypothetical protein